MGGGIGGGIAGVGGIEGGDGWWNWWRDCGSWKNEGRCVFLWNSGDGCEFGEVTG